MEVIISAIALFLLIEGTLYAIFPEKTKNMLRLLMDLPINYLRTFGLIMVTIGVVILWLT
jgi:uncharacterized protein